MGIWSAPNIVSCKTIYDWKLYYDKYQAEIHTLPGRILSPEQVADLVYLAIHGIAPFCIIGVLFQSKITYISGMDKLIKLVDFFDNKIAISRKIWPHIDNFPINFNTLTYDKLPRALQSFFCTTEIACIYIYTKTMAEYKYIIERLHG